MLLEECLPKPVLFSMDHEAPITVYERLVEERILRDALERPLLEAWLDEVENMLPAQGAVQA